MKKKLAAIFLTIIATIMAAQVVTAAYSMPEEFKPDNLPFDISNGTTDSVDSGETQIIRVLQVISGALLYFAAPLAVLSIGMTAFNMSMGSGNAEKIEASKKQLTWAILGLVLVILSYTIVKIVISFPFGIFG